MKRIALIALVVGFVFFSCDAENSTNGDEFTVSTNDSVSNDVATLGLVGTAVSSSNANVATVEIVSGKIKITSVSEGSAVITVSASGNNAIINITVSKTGSITIGTIVKYASPSQNGDEFTVSTNDSISNDVATLGLVGTAVSSSNTNIATVEIASGKIKITSVSEGSAVITVSASGNNAIINITVSKTGSITIGTIVKYASTTWVFKVETNGNSTYPAFPLSSVLSNGALKSNTTYIVNISGNTDTAMGEGKFGVWFTTTYNNSWEPISNDYPRAGFIDIGAFSTTFELTTNNHSNIIAQPSFNYIGFYLNPSTRPETDPIGTIKMILTNVSVTVTEK